MNSEKLVSCEISSEETDQQEAQDGIEETKRSYECTFCKRGFANAQALGGHMNIHRKDRAKAKKEVTHNSSIPTNKFTVEEYSMAPPFASGFPNQTTRHYSTLESQKNSDMHFHHPPAPPNLIRNQPQYAPHDHQYNFHGSRSGLINLNQLDLMGANLSLQIGPSNVDNNTHQLRRGTQEDNEVDLELRLGNDPY